MISLKRIRRKDYCQMLIAIINQNLSISPKAFQLTKNSQTHPLFVKIYEVI